MIRQSIDALKAALVASLFISSLSSGSPLKFNDGKIVGGEDAAITDYPWSVSLR